jgi:DNA ligase-1
MLTFEEWEAGESPRTYITRYTCLLDLITPNLNYVKLIHTYGTTNDEDLIMQYFEHETKVCGGEGLMLKANTQYTNKRNKNMLKLKRHDTVDLVVTRLEVGSGRNKDRLGAAICEYKGNEVAVGGGFSDNERSEFWKNPNAIVGKTIEVSFMQETKNQNGEFSLRHPQFERIREDK